MALPKILPNSPDPYLKRLGSNKSQSALARLAHINALVEAINTNNISFDTYVLGGLVTVTSQILNGEEVDFLIQQGGILTPATFTCTGVLLTYSGAGVDYKNFNGVANAFGIATITSIYQSEGAVNKASIYTTINQDDTHTYKVITTDNNATLELWDNYITSTGVSANSYNSYTAGVPDASPAAVKFDPKNTTGENIIFDDNAGDTHYYQAYRYAEVDLTDLEIKTLVSVGKEILPTPGINKYYAVSAWSLEFTEGTTPYTIAARQSILLGTFQYANIDAGTLLGSGTDRVVSGTEFGGGTLDGATGFTNMLSSPVNQPIYISAIIGGDPTLGDGTLKVKIWYQIRTFG